MVPENKQKPEKQWTKVRRQSRTSVNGNLIFHSTKLKLRTADVSEINSFVRFSINHLKVIMLDHK